MRAADGRAQHAIQWRWPDHASTALAVLLVGVLLASSLVVFPVGAQTPDTVDDFATAAMAPADALSYTVVPLRDNDDQWTQAMALLERVGLGAAVAEFQEEAFDAGSDEDVPVDLFLGGEAAMVLTDVAANILINESMAGATGAPASFTDREMTESGLAFVFTADNPDFIELAIESAIDETASDLGTDVKRTEHAGVSIQSVAVPAGSGETPMAVARIDDFILVAGFAADLEPMIDAGTGARPALADLNEFGQVRAALDQDHLAFGFVNAFPSEALRTDLGRAGVPVGLLSSQSAAGGYLIAADELGFRFETVSLGTDAGAADATLAESRMLAQTPEDALVFFAASDLAGTGILDRIGALLLGASGLVPPSDDPGSLDEMLDAQFEQLARTIGVNLRSELLIHLTGEYGFWLELDPSSGAINALFASGVDDPVSVAGALFQITLLVQSAGSGEMNVASRPVGDEDRVFTIQTGDMIVPLVEYGVVGEQLVVGLGNAVDNVGEEPSAPLADSEAYQAIMSALPEPTQGMLYLDLRQSLPLLASAVDATAVDDVAAVVTGNGDPAGDTAAEASAEPVDADPSCAQFASQADAQAAFEAFAPGSFQLDQDFDGEACDDYFNGNAASAATPEAAAAPAAPAVDTEFSTAMLSAFAAYGMVAYEEDGNNRTSSLLLIDTPDD